MKKVLLISMMSMGLISGVAVAQTSPNFANRHKTPIMFSTIGPVTTVVGVQINNDRVIALLSNSEKPRISELTGNKVTNSTMGQPMFITGVQLLNSDTVLACEDPVEIEKNLVNVIITQDSQGHTYCQKPFTTN